MAKTASGFAMESWWDCPTAKLNTGQIGGFPDSGVFDTFELNSDAALPLPRWQRLAHSARSDDGKLARALHCVFTHTRPEGQWYCALAPS